MLNIRPLVTLTVLFVFMSVAALNPGSAQEAQLQEPPTIIDPALRDALQDDAVVDVLISLKEPDLPVAQVTTDLRRQNTSQVQGRVLSILAGADFTLTHKFEISAALGGRITQSGLAKLADLTDVIAIGLGASGTLYLNTSVPLISANLIHTLGYDGSGVNIAVLETGIDTDHPDLMDSIVLERCFIPPPYNGACGPPAHPAEDTNGHGTRVSGIITSNGTVSSIGVAPGSGIYAYKVASVGAFQIAVLEALEHIEANGYPVDFVVMNFGLGPLLYAAPCSGVYPAIETQLQRLLLFGDVTSFAAAGNEGDKSQLPFPACHSAVVPVGEVYDKDVGVQSFGLAGCTDFATSADKVSCESNSSDHVGLLAPGCRITSTGLGGGIDTDCGTSYAAPHAIGVAALVRDAQPGLSTPEILARMKSTGKWVYDDLASRWTPRIDARVASLTNDDGDSDGDGCKNGFEFGSDPTLGGQRNPLDPWDYYDVTVPKDGAIVLIGDVTGVIAHFSPGGGPPYDAYYDRGPLDGPNAWNMTAPDGVIVLIGDITGVLAQVNHYCT